MHIEVIKPKKFDVTELTFELDARRNKLTLTDKLGRNTVVTFKSLGTFIPSTLLSRWVSFHLYKEMLQLKGLGSSVGYASGQWKFRENPKYFGLHDFVDEKGNVSSVKIDDSIGMKKVVDIINALGYTVDTEFDVDTNRMVKIFLVKEL